MNRQLLIRIFTFLGGIYFFVEYLLPEKIGDFQFNRYNDQITQGFMAVTAMTFGLGLINIIAIHGSRIAFLRKGWINSAGLLLGLLAMLWVTASDWRASSQISGRIARFSMLAEFSTVVAADLEKGAYDAARTAPRIEALKKSLDGALNEETQDGPLRERMNPEEQEQYASILGRLSEAREKVTGASSGFDLTADPQLATAPVLSQSLRGYAQAYQEQQHFLNRFTFDYSIYHLLYDGLFIALGSAMFSLLGFYMAAAAYRAFRVRSFESSLMMGAAVIVMLGQIPFGLWIWDGFTDLRLWLLSTPSTAAFRAVKFGAAVAGLVMAFRMWLSIETDSFSEHSGGQR